MRDRAPLLFALAGTRSLGERVAGRLGVPLAAHEERDFEDGEHKARPLVSVRGGDVYVLHSLHGDAERSVNDRLCRLLFFIGALRDAGAARVTAVVPYLCFARKERKTKARDPVTTRYVAALFEAVGTDRVVAVDVHNLAGFQNAFRCRTEHLEARGLIAAHLAPALAAEPVVVVSPDTGGFKRAEAFRKTLTRALGREAPLVFLEKQRSEGKVSGETVVGDVAGRAAVILDDLVSTGTTLVRAARACRARGAGRIYAAATHGLFVGGARELLTEPSLERVVVTDSVAPLSVDPELAAAKLVVLDLSPLLAGAIERLHDDGSIVELLDEAPVAAQAPRGPGAGSLSAASSR